MKTYLSWSGGKDSTASIILAHEKNIPIDLIIISLPYFDKEKGIYADHPKHIEWLFEKAIPTIETWGYKVNIVINFGFSKKEVINAKTLVITESIMVGCRMVYAK